PADLAASQQVMLAWFASPRDEALPTLAIAHAAFADAAKEAGGWVEDLDTGSVYGADAWSERDPRGPITDWFVVEAQPAANGAKADVRLVTRGLRRFGLPEITVEDLAAGVAPDVSFVVNGVATELYARATRAGDGELPPTLTLHA